MSALLTGIFLFIVLIVCSIIFNFWIYLVIIGVIIFGILLAIGHAEVRHAERRRRMQQAGVWDMDIAPNNFNNQLRQERVLRRRVEDEWDRQGMFGNDEDLR